MYFALFRVISWIVLVFQQPAKVQLFPYHVTDPKHAGLNDLRIYAAQVKLFSQG
jgi:hypothetical protein